MVIAICDDDKRLREILAKKVSVFFPDETVEAYGSGEELLAAARIPDILLLDILLPGLSGMETAKRLRQRSWKMQLIFITGEEQYVFDAFDVRAFHYLVKPFSDERLKEVLEQARSAFLQDNGEKEKRYTMVTSRGTHIRICLEDIVYAEVFNAKVVIHTIKEDIEYYGKLSELEKTAGKDFFRTHRAYLVHLKYVEKYDASTVYLGRGTALISKQNYPVFVRKLLEYNRRRGLFG